MTKLLRISAILHSGGFRLYGYVGRLFDVGFLTQCSIVAAFFAFIIVLASFLDHSLTLDGRNIGLLQHPTIWCFLVLQIALPLSMRHSLANLLKARTRIREITELEGSFRECVVEPLLRFLRLQDGAGRTVATLVYCAGIAAFVWNTYQNQFPKIIVPYDFWDSTTYLFGFWVTRVYKLYLFCWLLPYIAMIHFGILIVTLRLVRHARVSGRLKLLPFHPDNAGGLGFMPGLMTTPIIVALMMSAVPTAAAFQVHRAVAVTPLIGLTTIVACAGIAYLIPILFLRSDIVALKVALIGRLRSLQHVYYSKIVETQNLDVDLKNSREALDYFDKICARVELISNYPHLKRLLKYIGLAVTPSVIGVALKIYEIIIPMLNHSALKKP